MALHIRTQIFMIALALSLTVKDSIVFISKSTPSALLSYFSEAVSIFNLSLLPADSIEMALPAINFLFFIDITLSQSFSPILNLMSSSYNVSYISVSKFSSTSSNRIDAHYSLKEEAKALAALLNYTSVSKFVLLGSAGAENIEFSTQLKLLSNFDKYISYSNDISLTTAKSIGVKMIKVAGITSVVLSDSGNSISMIEAGLTGTKFSKAGAILIYTSRSFPMTYILGSLLISEDPVTVATDLAQYHYLGVLRILNCFNSRVNNRDSGAFEKHLVNQVLAKCNLKPSNFSIFNVQGKSMKKVGTIIGSLNPYDSPTVFIIEKIVYPGNITARDQYSQAVITLSISNGTNDPYNSFHYERLATLYQGSLLAVSQINNNNEIPHFIIKLTPTDCGMFWYEQYWYLSCHSRLLNSLGVAYITSLFGPAIKGNIYSMRTLNHVIAQVSPLGLDATLDNKTEYPELVKLEISYNIFNGAKMTVLKSLGYYSILLIMSNDTEIRQQSYKLFHDLIINNGMKVIEYPPEFEFIKYNYTRDDFEAYKQFFLWVRSTGCSVFFLGVLNNPMVLEGLYDVGFRRGEFFLFIDSSALEFLDGVEEPFYTKRKELIEGAVIYSYKEWVGELGAKIFSELSALYEDVTYMCMTYDAVIVIKEAINYLLASGGDFEDYSSLMNTIRKNKFTGCLGNVFFDNDGNTRSSGQLLFQQIYFNETISKLVNYDLLYFDRFSTQTITQINPMLWPNGIQITNFRAYNRCPFDTYQKVASEKGKHVLYAVSAAVFTLCLIVAIITSCSFPNTIEPLTEKEIISLNDFIFFGFFLLQFFQNIAMGPNQDSYKYILNNFQILLSFNFELYFKLTFSKFWALFNTVCVITIYCVAIFPIYLGLLENRFGNSYVYIKLSDFARLTLPFFCHLGYMPILSMLLNIFNCTEAIGQDYSDAYLIQDCTIFCYTGIHREYVIFVSIFMTIFVILTIYYRPYFENNHNLLHIRTKPWYLSLLSIVQTSIVVLNKTLKVYSQVAHGVAVTSILVFYLVLTLCTQPFNYGRAKVAQCVALIGSIWAIGISTIFIDLSLLEIWTIVEFSGLILIAALGLIFLKRYPELLHSEKGISISTLFIFQCFSDFSKYKSNAKSLEELPKVRNYSKIKIDSTSKDNQIEISSK